MPAACPTRKTAPVLLRLAAVLLASATSAPLYAQVTAISTPTNCRTPVLTNPSATNPLRIQAGTVEFEAWGALTLSRLAQPSVSLKPALSPAPQVTVVEVRSSSQNSSRGCPAQSSVVLRLQTTDALSAQATGTLSLPLAGGTTQRIGLTVLPHPGIGWAWQNTAVGGVHSGCTVPNFDYQYLSTTVLKLTVPFGSRLGVECKQRLASRLLAGPLDVHVTAPIPIRLTTNLASLPASDLPVPIQPDALPATLKGPRATASVPIVLSSNGVLRRQRDFPLEVSTPNGKTASITASIVGAPQDLSYSIGITGWVNPPDRTRLVGETTTPGQVIGVFPTIPFDLLFNIDPAVREFSLPVTWRLTNSGCFSHFPRAGSMSFNPASTFHNHNLAQGATFFEVVLVPRDTATCLPAPGQSRDETLEIWVGTDTSRAPAGRATIRVVNSST